MQIKYDQSDEMKINPTSIVPTTYVTLEPIQNQQHQQQQSKHQKQQQNFTSAANLRTNEYTNNSPPYPAESSGTANISYMYSRNSDDMQSGYENYYHKTVSISEDEDNESMAYHMKNSSTSNDKLYGPVMAHNYEGNNQANEQVILTFRTLIHSFFLLVCIVHSRILFQKLFLVTDSYLRHCEWKLREKSGND